MTKTAVDRTSQVRAFNRFYTRVIGVLGEGLLSTPYSLTEARVLFELGHRDVVEVSDLRAELGLDRGYLSRILARFEADGLVVRSQSQSDGRRQVVRLSSSGRDAFSTLDTRSAHEVAGLLETLTVEDQVRLVGAMEAIHTLLERGSADETSFVLRAPGPGDFGWVVARHGALYAREYGWDERFEGLVARIVSDYVDSRDPATERAWIAEMDGAPVGGVFCVRKDDTTAQLRLLLVEPHARGAGIGARLVDECIAFARSAGYGELVLWTNDVLDAARRIYRRAGFSLVEEEPHHSFGHDLVGQSWRLDLRQG